jgi:hypothetical protein
MDLYDREEQKYKREYNLKCLVVVKDTTYDDLQSQGSLGLVTEKMVYLKPEPGSETDRFFDAWLPCGKIKKQDGTEIGRNSFELAVRCGHPINGHFRVAVKRRDQDFPDHHLFVMTVSAENDLKEMDNKHVFITVLSEDDENMADRAKPSELAINKHG